MMAGYMVSDLTAINRAHQKQVPPGAAHATLAANKKPRHLAGLFLCAMFFLFQGKRQSTLRSSIRVFRNTQGSLLHLLAPLFFFQADAQTQIVL